MNEPMKERFLRDVAEHQMAVFMDDDMHRHLGFARDGSNIMSFQLITWPGHLCICGDMGSYVFRRLPDMFEFFRSRGGPPLPHGDGQERINPSYWAEKLVAVDRHDGVREFSREKFRASVVDWFRMYWDGTDRYAERRECWNDVRTFLLENDDINTPEIAIREAMELPLQGFPIFQDFWDADVSDWTFRFLWCCHAIVWGISVYDQRKVAA